MTGFSKLILLIPSFLLRSRIVLAENLYLSLPWSYRNSKFWTMCLRKNSKAWHRKYLHCFAVTVQLHYWFDSVGITVAMIWTYTHFALGIPGFYAINIHSAIWLMRELPRTGDSPWGCSESQTVHLNSLMSAPSHPTPSILLLSRFPNSEFLSITCRHQQHNLYVRVLLWGFEGVWISRLQGAGGSWVDWD